MATLAEVLRGYTPPTESALADPIKQHFANLPQTTAQNAKAMNNMIQNAIVYDPATGKFNEGPTYSEFANYVPNLMGSATPRKEVIGGVFDKIMGVFGKNKTLQMPEGVMFEKLHPTVQEKVKQGMIDPGDAQWMSDYAYTPGQGLVETGTGAWKDQSERMQNFVRRMEKGEISIPEHWQGEGGIKVGNSWADK
jgi:hypothetical protein